LTKGQEKLPVPDIRRPFAYSVVKIDLTTTVTSTIGEAVAAARESSADPSRSVEVFAWFEDGPHQKIPFESLGDV
jgi:hypothetical protein